MKIRTHASLLGIALGTNLLLASFLGVLLAGILIYEQPGLVFKADTAGVPMLVYGLISTAIPVVLVTLLGHGVLAWLARSRSFPRPVPWHAAGATVGSCVGLAGGSFLFDSARGGLIGLVVGAACGACQAYVWWWGTCTPRSTVA